MTNEELKKKIVEIIQSVDFYDGLLYRYCIDIATADKLADALIAAGYRKQSDTVREFLKLLKEKESPKLLMWEYGEGYLDCIKTAEELAAQYGVEVEE